jgi:hypothetical protein
MRIGTHPCRKLTGQFTLTGVEQAANIGSYTQARSVGGTAITPAISFVARQSSSAGIADGYLTAPAIAWDTYDLQTDHYAVIPEYLFSDGYYQNTLYFGDGSCDDASSDCTIGLGGGVFWVELASIYVGSTLADQAAVPTNDIPPAFDTSAYDHFLAGANPPYPSGAIFKTDVTEWIKAVGAAYTPVKLVYDAAHANDTGATSEYPPIPFYVDLVNGGDVYDLGTAERQRTFTIRDLYGRAWNMNFPLRIRERFTEMTTAGGATAPVPDGTWSILVPSDGTTPNDVQIRDSPQFTDHHHGTTLNLAAQVNYLQYYYATNFNLPVSSLGLTPFFYGVPGVPDIAMPLWIRDAKNKCSPFPYLPAEGISTSGQHVYIDGDNGPGTGCRQ